MDVFEISLDAINQSTKQLETVSQNVANINTPGYLSTKPFVQYLSDQRVAGSGEVVSLTEGTIRETGRALDVAVLDGGFFEVELNNQRYITRGGHFYVDGQGLLRHPSGAYVLGENGKIDTGGLEVTFGAEGSVAIAGNVIDKLSIVKARSAQGVTPVGQGLYATDPQNTQVVSARISQKSLNSANVNPSEEMVRMIEISRHLQSTQKMVNAYDQLLNVGINELGKK